VTGHSLTATPAVAPPGCRDRLAAGEDTGIDHHQNWLRFTYDSTSLRSHWPQSLPAPAADRLDSPVLVAAPAVPARTHARAQSSTCRSLSSAEEELEQATDDHHGKAAAAAAAAAAASVSAGGPAPAQCWGSALSMAVEISPAEQPCRPMREGGGWRPEDGPPSPHKILGQQL
jgi:hypothetical protein